MRLRRWEKLVVQRRRPTTINFNYLIYTPWLWQTTSPAYLLNYVINQTRKNKLPTEFSFSSFSASPVLDAWILLNCNRNDREIFSVFSSFRKWNENSFQENENVVSTLSMEFFGFCGKILFVVSVPSAQSWDLNRQLLLFQHLIRIFSKSHYK